MMLKPTLLSGDNPQIPKGYGDASVQAFIAAVPGTGPGGWKQAVCRRIDAVVSAEVPGVAKAVKWNSPFYGSGGPEQEDCWFLSFHCFAKYVKVTFFRGTSLGPMPPEGSKAPEVRYLNVPDPALGGDELGEQFADWVRQAAALPGVRM